MFDGQINRLPGVDPEIENGQESLSPYAFGYDNAVRFNDPNGRYPGEGEGPPGGGVTVAGMITGTFYGIAASVANTVLAMGDYANPASMAAMITGGSVRAVGDANGVHYESRAASTSPRQLAGNVAADVLDTGQTALTVATAGSGSLAGRALPMGAGLLLAEAGGEKVVANAAVQKGKSLVRFGTDAESAQKLGADAAKAEAAGFPHGVSTMQHSTPVKGARNAPREQVEQTFAVKQTGKNPRHHTVILPKPVTEHVANQFNEFFKLK